MYRDVAELGNKKSKTGEEKSLLTDLYVESKLSDRGYRWRCTSYSIQLHMADLQQCRPPASHPPCWQCEFDLMDDSCSVMEQVRENWIVRS